MVQAWHGGRFSNRTVARILEESILIELYRKMQTDVEKNFSVTTGTTAHSPPNFKKGLARTMRHLKQHSLQTLEKGRETKYEIVDALHDAVDLVEANFYNLKQDCLPQENETSEASDIGPADLQL